MGVSSMAKQAVLNVVARHTNIGTLNFVYAESRRPQDVYAWAALGDRSANVSALKRATNSTESVRDTPRVWVVLGDLRHDLGQQ